MQALTPNVELRDTTSVLFTPFTVVKQSVSWIEKK